MPDLRQALKDFVATSNSGKYATEEELLSKFPELKGYDVQVLRDFVATNNSGKYKTEDELFAKFPEFKLGGEVKKKFSSDSEPSQQPQQKTMESSSEDGSLDIKEKFRKSLSIGIKPMTPEKSQLVLPKEAKKVLLSLDPEKRKQFVKAEADKFKKASTVTQEEEVLIKEELKAKRSGEGFWNTAEDITNRVGNFLGKIGSKTAVVELFRPTNLLEEETKKAKQELLKQGIKSPTKAQLDQEIDRIFIENKKKEAKQDKMTRYLDDLDVDTKNALELNAKESLKTLDKKQAELTDRIKANSIALESFAEDMASPNISEEDKRMIADEIVKTYTQLKEDFEVYSKSQAELGSVSDEFEALKRNYNTIDNVLAKTGLAFADLGLGVVSFVDYVNQYTNPIKNINSEELQAEINQKRELINQSREVYRPELNDIQSFEDLAQYSTDLLAGQSANIALIASTGGVGGATILGVSQGGQTYSDMYKEMNKGAKYSPMELALAPLVSGVSTAILSELPTAKTLANTKRVFMSAIKEEAGREAIDQAVKKTTESIAKQVFDNYKREIPTELMDNIIQNAIQKDIIGKKDVGYFDNSWKVLKDTALMTTLIGTAPQVGFQGVKMFLDKSTTDKLDSNAKKIVELSKQLDKALDEETKAIIQKQIDAATKESSEIIDTTLEKISSMPDSDVQKVVENNSTKAKLLDEAKAVKENENLDVQAKEIILSDLKDEYKSKTEENNQLISKENAIQEQSPAAVPVQPETRDSQAMEEGISQPKPEVVTEQITQEEIVDPLRDVESTANALNEDLVSSIENAANILFPKSDETNNIVAETYHQAKADGSNPELVKAVEELLSTKPQEEVVGVQDEISQPIELSVPEVEATPIETKVEEAKAEEAPVSKEYDSDNKNNEENMSVLSKVLDKEGIVPPAEPMILESGNLVSVTYRGQDFNSPETTITFNKNKNGAWSIKGYKVETTTEPQAVSEQDFEEVATTEITTAEADKIKSDVEASKERLKKAWDKYKTVGIAFDPKNNLARDKELVSALVEYAYQKTKLGAYTASKLIEDLANEGFKITRNGAKFIMDKVASEALKEEVRDLKGQVVDVFRAGIDSMKITGRTAKEKAKAIKEKTQEIAKYLGDLEKSGKITSKQASALIRRFSKVNALSEKSVNRFIDYATKIINDATYNSKILAANKVRKEIKKLSRDKDKNADLRNIASKFAEIDPSMVDDIDQYNEIASRVKEAVKGSKKRLDKITIARTVNIDEVSNYVSETINSQDEKIRQEMIAEIQSLMDIDASDLSAEEMISLLDSEEKINKENESVVRKTLKKAFDVYSSMINESIRTGKNLFTDEDIKYTQKQKDIISKFMKMDTDKMTVKEALGAIDSLINFLGNGSTAKMATTIAEYTGEQNSQEVADNKKLVRTSLKKLWSKAFAKFLGEQITSLPILFEKKFKGFNAGGYVMDKMGLNDLINKKSLAQRMANTIVDNYVKKFYEKKANGQAFNTLFNSIERGMSSFVMRNIVGTEAEMQEEFNRRKGLIEQSIDALENGNEDEKSMAKVYKEVYDKILKDSSNSDEVKSKADSINIEAVNWWINEWDDKFEDLSDVAKNVYNKILDRDLDYTPDKFTKFKYDRSDSDLANSDSAFINNTDGILYKKETGVLMSKKPSSMLPENKKGNPTAYVDLSFDKNNSNSMYDALVDMQTAESVRQIQSFMDSKNFEKIFGEDSQIFKNRIKLYIQNSRKKNPFSQDELSNAFKSLNRISAIGASVSLAGPTQPIKQVFPVVVNTLVNTGGKIDLTNDKNFNEWLNKSGYAISNRGVESQAQIDSINKLIEQAASSKGEALIKKLEELNKFYLKIFLANPDVYIARASWKSYYEKSLENQGVKTKDLDYSNHEVNKEAADYAQRMVDRQQNISDTDLSGKLFSAKDTSTQVLTKIFMPFASFRMNQSSRLAADLTTLGYWNSATKEDRQIAIKSLSGFALEQTVFKTLSALISIGMASLASSYVGDDDDDEKKRKNQLIKGAATGTVSDIFSPLPVADRFVQWTAAKGLDFSQDMMGLSDKQKISLYEPKTQDFFQQLGMFGIVGTKASDVASLVDIYATGTYEDKYGNIRDVSNENREKLGALIGPAILAGMGILPPETSSFIRNSEKIAKKKAPTLEEKIEKDNKIEELKKIVDESSSQDEIDAAEKMINKLESPEIYEEENQYLKELKQSLLVDEENGVTYDNVTDLKNFNPDLWEKNFGPGSEWDDLTKGEKEVKRTLKKKEESKKEEKYGMPSQKKERNSDGTRKRKYKTYRKFRKTKD